MDKTADELFAEAGPRQRVLPLMVGSLREPRPSDEVAHPPYGMAITLDVDAISGLSDVIARQRGGEVFDVVARWGAAMDETGEHSPLVLVDFFMPQTGVGAEIGIEVDQFPDSLIAGIQSGRIVLLDSDLSEVLQKRDISATLTEYKPITLEMPDPKPAIGVLQQRFDFPRGVYAPQRRDVTPETSEDDFEEFVAGAALTRLAALQYRPDGAPTIILVDPGSAGTRAQIDEDATVEGRWGALGGDEHCLLRFDAFADGTQIGSWLLPDPGEQIIRGGASGAHWVAVLADLPREAGEEADRQWQEGLHAWVPHVEVFRTLLVQLYS